MVFRRTDTMSLEEREEGVAHRVRGRVDATLGQIDVGETNVCTMIELGWRDAAFFEVTPEGAIEDRNGMRHGEYGSGTRGTGILE